MKSFGKLVLLACSVAAQSVVDRVVASPKLATLASVLSLPEYGDLLAALGGSGPFTVFAPSNQAFQEANIDVTDVDAVTAVLAYHVVPKSVFLGGVQGMDKTSYPTVNGAELNVQALKVTTKKGKKNKKSKSVSVVSRVNDAEVVVSNIEATNGFVHIIDKVLMPPILPSIVQAAVSAEALSTLVSVLTMPEFKGVLELLSGPGPFTVFAPSNEAFAHLNLDLTDVAAIADVLAFHVVPGAIKAGDLAPDQLVDTVSERTLRVVKTESGKVVVNNDAYVVIADVLCSNGVVHVVDRVLLPHGAPSSAGDPQPLEQVQASLQQAIFIGAPLFNAGNFLGCYQAYARAVFEVVVTSSPGYDKLAPALAASLDSAVSATDKSWRLRSAMDQVLAIPAPIVSAVSTEMGQASFAVDVMTMAWQSVDDTVMGGVSSSNVVREGSAIKFSGFVTTASNGGFVTARATLPRPLNLNSCRGLTMMAKASSSSRYTFELGNNFRLMGPSFEADFYPSTEWAQVDLPFSEFTQQSFGSSTRVNFNKASVASLGLKKSAFLKGSLQKDPAFVSGSFSLWIKDVACLV